MTTLKHDSQGFLVGELIEADKEIVGYLKDGLSVQRSIKRDVNAMARAMGIRASNGMPAAVPAGRGEYRGQVRGAPSNTGKTKSGSSPQQSSAPTLLNRPVGVAASPRGRDGSGRFIPGGGGKPPTPGDEKAASRFDKLVGAMSRMQGVAQGAEQIDPAIAAAREVKDVLSPVGRGLGHLFRKENETKETKNKKAKAGTPIAERGNSGVGDGGFDLLSLPLLGSIAKGIMTLISAEFWASILSKVIPSVTPSKLPAAVAASGVVGAVAAGGVAATVGANGVMSANKEAFKGVAENPMLGAMGGDAALASAIYNANELAEQPVSKSPGLIQRGYAGVKNLFKGNKQRAYETGASYSAGNIGNLSDEQTRALVASTALTESAGGKLDIVNKQGYMGRYQAGAGWLADAGLINGGSDAVKGAMRRDGHTREWDWAQSGGMTRFLSDDKNWTSGMSREKYLSSADVQDAAFKKNSDAAYAELMRRGVIDQNSSPSEVAGLLKSRHLSGIGGAMQVARGGYGPSDSNGTSARKYYEDVAYDKSGFLNAYKGEAVSTHIPLASIPSIPSSVPLSIPPIAAVDMPTPASNERQRPLTVSLDSPIGQDVGDRGIAHIVSGGLGFGA